MSIICQLKKKRLHIFLEVELELKIWALPNEHLVLQSLPSTVLAMEIRQKKCSAE